MLVAGVDACRGGWFVVTAQTGTRLTVAGHRVCATFAEAAAWAGEAQSIAVDIPIGLPDTERRACDAIARKALGPRAMCVFWAPPRAVLAAKSYSEALAIHRRVRGEGVSVQAYGIMPKIAQVDVHLRASAVDRARVWEVHPELSFAALNGGRPVLLPKHSDEGFRLRQRLLLPLISGLGPWIAGALAEHPRSTLKADDVLDAAVACVTAARWDAEATIPSATPPVDSFGLRMEMRRPVIGSSPASVHGRRVGGGCA